MKNNLPWFRHYAEAPDHPKFEALRAVYGWAGEGRFWALNCFISRADGCRLDLSRPFLRAQIANKLGISLDELNAFLKFLSDQEQCGLLRCDGDIFWTDIVQEDYGTVLKKRQSTRGEKTDIRNGISECQNAVSDIRKGVSAPQSRVEKTRKEQQQRPADSDVRNGVSAAPVTPPAAAALFPPTEIKNRMAFHPAEVPLDDAAVEQLAKALQAVGCDNLDYLDFVLDRMTERCKGRPPKNPAGYLLRVAGLAEWYADWRRAREARQAVLERATAPPEAPARDEAVGAMLTDFLNGGLKGAGG